MTRYVRRFSRTERALHWANALGFLTLLGSGLVLYLPSLAVLDRHVPVFCPDDPFLLYGLQRLGFHDIRRLESFVPQHCG